MKVIQLSSEGRAETIASGLWGRTSCVDPRQCQFHTHVMVQKGNVSCFVESMSVGWPRAKVTSHFFQVRFHRVKLILPVRQAHPGQLHIGLRARCLLQETGCNSAYSEDACFCRGVG